MFLRLFFFWGVLGESAAVLQRSRLSNEIVPVSAQQASTYSDYEVPYGAMNALDMNVNSYAYLKTTGPYWWKATLGQVYRVYQVIDIWNSNSHPEHHRSWTCSEDGCVCEVHACKLLTATVSIEGATADLQLPESGCKNGNTVKIDSTFHFYLYEIAVTKKPESDCTTIAESWDKVVTVPVLPVPHGTALTLSCLEGYTNLKESEDTATCLYGQVVPTEGLPNCRLMRERVSDEITPASAEKSATFNDDAANHGAELAIDMDLGTAYIADLGPDTHLPWLKLSLVKLHCVESVIIYDSLGDPLITWTCSEDDCDICTDTQSHCNSYSLTVSTEGAAHYHVFYI
ncbi:hypothetical protein ACHWQZ_G000663 [Mnemiopsis leidyi]